MSARSETGAPALENRLEILYNPAEGCLDVVCMDMFKEQ